MTARELIMVLQQVPPYTSIEFEMNCGPTSRWLPVGKAVFYSIAPGLVDADRPRLVFEEVRLDSGRAASLGAAGRVPLPVCADDPFWSGRKLQPIQPIASAQGATISDLLLEDRD